MDKEVKTFIARIKNDKGIYSKMYVEAEDHTKARRKVMRELGFEGLTEVGKKRGRKRKYGG